MKNKLLTTFTLILIFSVALLYRVSGLKLAHPFWVDEFATVAQAKSVQRSGLAVFTNSDYHFEYHNITTHFITALFFQLFGPSEQIARLPAVIFGSLVPVLVFVLCRQLFQKKSAAWSATILTIFSYFQITWSVQARGYMLQQVLLLLSLIVYFKLSERVTKKLLCLFILIAILGTLTHTTYLLVLASIVAHLIYLNRQNSLNWIFKPMTGLAIATLGLIFSVTGGLQTLINFLISLVQTGLVNNVWYYHSFLWRQQTLTTLLGGFGLVLFWLRSAKKGSLLLLLVMAYLIFVCFIFAPYVSRYLLPIFPILLIGFGYSISELSDLLITKKQLVKLKNILPILLTLLIVMNGDKFVIKPKLFYSVDHDMREIAVIDYDQIYNLIQNQIQQDPVHKIAVIDPWAPRAEWYLGNSVDIFWFKWIDEPGLVNGMAKKTEFITDTEGNKFIPKSGKPLLGFVGELSDLTQAMKKYQRGFILVDDTSLPQEILLYVKQNLHQEIYLDHYIYDDNPYSVWPTTLYSWGVKTVNPYFLPPSDLKSNRD